MANNEVLYYLPEESRTITRAQLEYELEYIGNVYPCFINLMIEDMIDAELAIEIYPGKPGK